ncbi:hypothetical protein [Streptomyces cadmiisoli]|uniref:Uncharacterized protein n=1 Tax=Streptomyces cadmiisoli TaxID=2184053 RepID=A0A2Z4JEC8_9ACTN|nr:hypothetical protein [Streptomyces cadmiisoli]AWW43459.1 hypothetical protein DN051_43695 [Streptomyces cadmiisoli]
MTSTTPSTVDVILDEHALLALGAGNILVSRILHQSAATDAWRIHVALAALADADRSRVGVAAHVAMLDQIVFHPLDLAAVLDASGQPRSLGWSHTRHVAQPGPERPEGARVVTTVPKEWDAAGVRILDVSP